MELEIQKQTVYVLMLDHEMQLLQHTLGVFTTFEKLIEAQNCVHAPTTLYETYFEYTDDYPPVKNEIAIVETIIMEDRTAVIRATNLPGNYTGTRQMTIVDPDLEFVIAYIGFVGENMQELEAAFPDGKSGYETAETQTFDLGDENMDELRKLLG